MIKYESLPEHVVIIPDGNRRWARSHSLPEWHGHKAMMNNCIELLRTMPSINVKYFTFWGFSTENWNRSEKELSKLFWLFESYLPIMKKVAQKNLISIHHLGRNDRLPKKLLRDLDALQSATADYQKYHFALALDYGGRDELLRTFRKIVKNKQKITSTSVSQNLDTKRFPDPDLIIRSGGEQRISGIMSWQSVYSELYFSKKYYPEFDILELKKALRDFSKRNRRFGR